MVIIDLNIIFGFIIMWFVILLYDNFFFWFIRIFIDKFFGNSSCKDVYDFIVKIVLKYLEVFLGLLYV